MEIIRTAEAMQQLARALKKQGRVIGFVPTMGFLHEGHLSLMQTARPQCDVLVVSIFVNPTQFGPNEDLDQYPRDFKRDERLCQEAGVDLIFYPEVAAMYASDASVWVDEESLSGVLCGASRSGHFRGVCTVVAKLFNIVLPDLAVFGEKDAQQLRIIERMVRDLNFPVQVVRGSIVREPDGLAMSSRNKYLSTSDRQDALCLQRALRRVEALFKAGERRVAVLVAEIQSQIGAVASAEINYVEVVDDEALTRIECIDSVALVALAVRFGNTRLIDNAVLKTHAN